MTIGTRGKIFHPEVILPIGYMCVESMLPASDSDAYLSFLYIEKGTAIIKLGKKKVSLIAPVCLCLNEMDVLELSSSDGMKAHVLYFLPEVINSSFHFDNIRSSSHNISHTEVLDRYWLRPFIERNDTYFGQIDIGPVTGNRILQLLHNVKIELSEQNDAYWPCRSRSFLLELLCLIIKMFVSPVTLEHIDLLRINSDIERILLYLNANYHQKITIAQLTRHFETNRTTLSDSFQKATGMTIMSYLTKIRMQIASLMLRDTTLPINEIIGRVGYEDPTNFTRTFKKFTRCSPSEYRDSFYSTAE